MTLPPSPQDPGTPNHGAPWPPQPPGTPPAAAWPGASPSPAPAPSAQPAPPPQPGGQPNAAPAQPGGVVPPASPAGQAAPGYPAGPSYPAGPGFPADSSAPGAPIVTPGGPGGRASLPWWISGIPRQAWLRAALLGGLALAAGLIAALATSLLALRNASDAVAGLAPVGGDEIGTQWFPATIQLWGMGYLGVLGGEVKAEDSFLQMQGGVSAFFVPLVVPLASWAVLRWLAPRLGSPLTAPHWAPRAVLSVVTGLVAAIIVTLLTALIPVAASSSSTSLSLRSASFLGFIGVWAIIGVLVYFSLRPRGSGPWGELVRDASATALWHVWTLGLLFAIVALVYLCVKAKSGEPLLSFTLLIPFLGTALFQLAHLIPFTASGAATLGLSGASATSMSLFSQGVPGWMWPVALVLALVWLVLASVRWRVRRGLPGNNPLEWLALPSVYLLLGLALVIVDRLAVGMAFGTRGGAALSVGPAGWGFLVLALVGLAVEALSRYVAIPVLRSVPAGLRRFLSLGLPTAPSAPLPQAAAKPAAPPHGWGATPGERPGQAQGFPAPSGYPAPGDTPAAPGYAPAQPAGGFSPVAPSQPAQPGAQREAAAAPPWGQAPAAPASPAPVAPAQPAAPTPVAPAQPAAPTPAPPAQPGAPAAPWGAAPPPLPPVHEPDGAAWAPGSPAPQAPLQDPGLPPIQNTQQAAPAPTPPDAAAAEVTPEAPAGPAAVGQDGSGAPTQAEPAPGSAPRGGWTRPPREPGAGPRH